LFRLFDAVTEIVRLRRQLSDLKGSVKHNAEVWSGFRFIEISLIGAKTFDELIDGLSGGFPQAFPDIDCITLACFDNDYEITRLLTQGGKQAPHPAFVRLEPDDLSILFSNFNRPMLGICDDTLQNTFFPKFEGTLNSAAISPLIVQDRLIGSLNQGSCKTNRFSSSSATDMLQHLTAVTAVTVDNVLVHERLREDGLTDPLTGLSNRRFFERRLKEEVKRWYRNNGALSCMIVDIDFFKKVNDQYGHQVGDDVLKVVSTELGSDLRASDVLARYGGEEFVLLLPETDASHTVEIAERLRERIANKQDWQSSVPVTITISIGVSTLTAANLDQTQACNWLVRQADTALYKAKNRGRNCVVQANKQTDAN